MLPRCSAARRRRVLLSPAVLGPMRALVCRQIVRLAHDRRPQKACTLARILVAAVTAIDDTGQSGKYSTVTISASKVSRMDLYSTSDAVLPLLLVAVAVVSLGEAFRQSSLCFANTRAHSLVYE
jgi:hypothetical protein